MDQQPYGEKEITLREEEVLPAIRLCLARVDALDEQRMAQALPEALSRFRSRLPADIPGQPWCTAEECASATVRLSANVLSGAGADPGSPHSGLVLDVFDGVSDVGLCLLRLAGKAISLVASDVTNGFLGFALEFLSVSLNAAWGDGQGQGRCAESEGT